MNPDVVGIARAFGIGWETANAMLDDHVNGHLYAAHQLGPIRCFYSQAQRCWLLDGKRTTAAAICRAWKRVQARAGRRAAA